MFGFFKKGSLKRYKEALAEYQNKTDEEIQSLNVDEMVEAAKQPCYQIGKTADGDVTLYIRDGLTLVMNNQDVDTLVKMLNSAKDKV